MNDEEETNSDVEMTDVKYSNVYDNEDGNSTSVNASEEANYNFLEMGEIEKKREKIIEEFIQLSSLPKEEAELILIRFIK